MSQGKFSQPRPHRDEERQIEQAFRQVTGQGKKPPVVRPHPEETQVLPADLIEQAAQPAAQTPPIPAFDPETAFDPEQDFQPTLEKPPVQAPAFEHEPEDFPEPPPIPETLYAPAPGLYEAPEEPEDADDGRDWLDTAMAFFEKNKKMVLLGLGAVAVVLLVSVVSIFLLTSSDPYDNKILSNVYLGNVNVGGMSKTQAVNALRQAASQTYAAEDMMIRIGEHELRLSPKDTKITLDAKAAVDAAFDYGRTGSKSEQAQALADVKEKPHTIGLLPYLKMDTAYIQKTLTDYAANTGSTLKQTTYGLEGKEPELATDKFNPLAPTQTLVITMGTPGIGFDAQAVYQQVLEAYSMNNFQVTVQALTQSASPEPLDLEAVYKEFYIAPVDATINMQTFKPIPGAYGYDFDLEEAKKLVESADSGQELRISMRYLEPEITEENVLYRDVLGEYQTKHTNSENRNTNLKLACQALNGKILKPGETLSFNETLGERTADKGYKPAPSYSGLETVDSLGGGICQVSSTLYYAALLADLDIVSRSNHGFVSNYIPYGLDATVSWGGPDFKFRNSTNFPIKIEAEMADGQVKVKILGVEERDYYIKMEYKITSTQEPNTEYQDYEAGNAQGYTDGQVIRNGTTGYTVKTYRLKYRTKTNELISRDFEANSQYTMVSKIVARVKAPETQPPMVPTTPPTTPPVTEAPTQPTTPTKPTEPSAPSTPSEPVTPPVEPTPTPTPPATPDDGGQNNQGNGTQNEVPQDVPVEQAA